MSCCGGEVAKKFRRLQAQLARKGNLTEAEEAGQLADRFEKATRKASRIVSRMPRQERQAKMPAAVDKHYKACLKDPPKNAKGDKKEYCARIAWSIYCQNDNPSYSGCTEYGKTKKSRPY